MRPDHTICAIATPPGEGGVGIVRISGPSALAIVKAIYRTPRGRLRAHWPSHRLFLGDVVDPDSGEAIDQVLAVFMRGPRSYTGEDVVELQAHGGPAGLRRIVDAVLRLGARVPAPGEFTQRAFLNGRLDLAQAEAVIDVIRARTDLSRRMAMGQYAGRLSARVVALSEQLLDWIAQLEATLDFPEDDVPEVSRTRLAEGVERVLTALDRLLAGAEQGRVLRDGVRVAIVGAPNVGKSSLLNALLGEPRAIVTEVAGTTRDSIEEWLNIDGIPMRVIDTAGICDSDDRIETEGISRARRHLETADLVLLVLDGARPATRDDRDIASMSAARPRIVVVNKADLACCLDVSDLVGDDPMVRLSARTGENLDALRVAMAARVAGGSLVVGDELVGGNLRHRDVLQRAREHVRKALRTAHAGLAADFVTIDLRAAVDALGEITGTSVSDEVVRRIFSQFCLGK